MPTKPVIIRDGDVFGDTPSGGSGGSGLKSISWTGTGTASHSITFPEKPTLLLALQGSSGGGYLQFAPVEYGGTQWNYIWSNSYVNGSGGNVGLTYSADDLTMTMTHSNADGAAACNLSGVTYTLYYLTSGGSGGASVNRQVTLSASDWVGNDAPYVQTVTVTDMTADSVPIIGLVVSPTIETGNEQIKQWGYISRAASGENIITFYCYKNKPTVELTANVKVV